MQTYAKILKCLQTFAYVCIDFRFLLGYAKNANPMQTYAIVAIYIIFCIRKNFVFPYAKNENVIFRFAQDNLSL